MLIRVLFSLLLFLILCCPASAKLIKFIFEAEITSVENNGQQVWDPNTVLDSLVNGYVLLDTNRLVGGREETSYYWWWDIDSSAGALTSELTLAGQTFSLTGANDFNVKYDTWVTNEFIEAYYGSTNNGGNTFDDLYFNDRERFDVVKNGIAVEVGRRLNIGLFGFLDEFFILPDPTAQDDTPFFDQLFEWQDTEFRNGVHTGMGSLNVTEFYFDEQSNPKFGVDSTVNFQLTNVSSSVLTSVSEPATVNVLGASLLLLLIRRCCRRKRVS